MKKKRILSQLERERLQRELHADAAQRRRGYRERALGLFPHLCASCGREFSGQRLKELTVHHKDHDHSHNPPDGSNWELLCIYCHDHQHEKYLMKGHGGTDTKEETGPPLGDPFSGLDALLGKEHDNGTDR